MMIYSFNDKFLTVIDAPKEEAFKYSPNYDSWIKVLLTKEIKTNGSKKERNQKRD